jgi:putative restriction endonuclease
VEILQDLLARLPARHHQALEWYRVHAGTEQPWPSGISDADGTILLATRAKGIYKPNWSDYALSARQVLKSRYPEKGPEFRKDGTWIYGYFQESDEPAARDSMFTNRALMRCLEDSVPVGVMRQTSPKPAVRYEVLGLALVAGWDDGYFFFEGFGPDGLAHLPGITTEVELLSREQEKLVPSIADFDALNIIDARERTLAQIVRRRGQREFREALIAAYKGRCAISGCNAVEVLEAAHIMPYKGAATNRAQNGLLLRSDLHTLFDLGLLVIVPKSLVVLVAPSLMLTDYRHFSGCSLRVPEDDRLHPDLEALRRRREWAGF